MVAYFRGINSAGRVSALQAGSRRFKSCIPHQSHIQQIKGEIFKGRIWSYIIVTCNGSYSAKDAGWTVNPLSQTGWVQYPDSRP